MKAFRPLLLALTAVLAGGAIASAQDAMSSPPKVIQIMREWIKPGKAGMAHDRSEAAFVSLMNRAKLQGHYVALNSMSGKSRALYVTRYPSYEAWEADNKTLEKSAAFSSELDRAIANDGELLEGTDSAVFTYDERLSYHPRPDLSHARYYELSVFHVRPGHAKEWSEVVKMYKDACDKAGNGAHWGMYQAAFGIEAGTYIALTHRAALAEFDTDMANGAKFVEAMGGEEAMQKFDELFGQAVDTSRTELFSINPRQSYAEEEWIKADPDFWKPKPRAPEAAAAKPAAPKTIPPATSKSGTR